MTLSLIEAEAFFRIWSTVDAYVCRRAGVLPGIERPEQVRHRPVEDLAKARKALWYVREHHGLSGTVEERRSADTF